MVPDPSLSIRDRAIASWPPAWHGQNLRDILVTLGYDVDIPWKELSEEERHWILFTEDTPTVPVYPGLSPEDTRVAVREKMTPGYGDVYRGATLCSAYLCTHPKCTDEETRLSFMEGKLCPVCHGKRLKPESLSVTFAGVGHR